MDQDLSFQYSDMLGADVNAECQSQKLSARRQIAGGADALVRAGPLGPALPTLKTEADGGVGCGPGDRPT
jgi:hypothetical protein